MTMKICYAIIQDGVMKLPEEALEILPQDKKLYLRTDSEKGTILIYAVDPSDQSLWPNQEYFAEMGKIWSEENWDEYSQPVPEELLRRARKEEDKT